MNSCAKNSNKQLKIDQSKVILKSTYNLNIGY